FQHDRAPAHYSRRVREILDERFPDKWIGRGGPIVWPARSPDFNVLDYFVWGYAKAAVEHIRDGTQNEVREEIVAAFQTITPDMAHRATRQISRRVELCKCKEGTSSNYYIRSVRREWIRPTGEPLKKKRAKLSTSRWCGNDSVSGIGINDFFSNIFYFNY
ncbi:hypothetical protein ALC60_12302, partial [Trachymyrmex zeteki]